MKKPKLSDINQTIDAIEAEMVQLVKSTKEEMLKKVAPGEETESEEHKDDSATKPAPEASVAPEATAPPEVSASPEANPEMTDPAMEQEASPPTHEELVQCYSELPPDQLEQHWLAIQEVKASMGAEATPPAAPVAPEASPPSPEATMKSEAKHVAEDLAKAEKSISDRDAELARLRKEMAGINEKLAKQEADLVEASSIVESYLRRPDRKAVTAAPPQAKAEEDVTSLSKSEITTRLRKACRRSDLKPADRKAIDNFLFTGEGLDKIRSFIVGA